MPTLRKGCKAYWDTSIGAISCEVISVYESDYLIEARFVLTESLGPYTEKEVLSDSALWVLPKECLYTRRGEHHYRVRPYEVQLDQD